MRSPYPTGIDHVRAVRGKAAVKACDIQQYTQRPTSSRVLGKDGLMLNIDGKNYVENHQYSKKVKTMTWKDERYTDAESLKEDAEAKLDELSKPYRSYTAEIINLVEAVQDEEKKEQYKEVFSIALGDTVLLISKSTGIRESHRIVKFYEYPLTKEKNKVELANTRLSFEEVQRTEQELS